MPRPADHYTHAQFEAIESDFQGETVQCIHCKQWTGSVKTLNRKKDHLLKCPAYAAWRAAGNGQDLPPPNRYSKRDSSALEEADPYSSPYTDMNNYGPQYTPTMTRNRLQDPSRFFDEFWDDNATQKVSMDLSSLTNATFIGDENDKIFFNQLMEIVVIFQDKDYEAMLNHFLNESFKITFNAQLNAQAVQNFSDAYYTQCMRTRCNYCGAVRAKNTTRQFEHLQTCTDFLNSTEGQQAAAEGQLQAPPAEGGTAKARPDIWRGSAPNPNLVFNRHRARASGGRPNNTPMRPAPQKPSPSLASHLLGKNHAAVTKATQQKFLQDAGSGTLSGNALGQWFTQQGHLSRALINLIGCTIGKIRLATVENPQTDTNWRTLDLLVSCINNSKRELEFLRTTQQKYALQDDGDPPEPATKGLIDLFAYASSPAATLLECMVTLWAVQYLHCTAWQYASTFVETGPPHPTSYSLPDYLQSGQYDMTAPFGHNTNNAALREALIPNWTSAGFSKFADACKSIVDELANAQTTGNGAQELGNCELVFKQITWLWVQLWPDVNVEEDQTMEEAEGPSQANENENDGDGAIEIPDDDDEAERDEDAPSADSPYEGTGLGAVAAANQVS